MQIGSLTIMAGQWCDVSLAVTGTQATLQLTKQMLLACLLSCVQLL